MSLLIAGHRSDMAGSLILRDANGGMIAREEFNLTREATGGRKESGFQAIALSAPGPITYATLSVEIHHLSFLDDGSGMTPYLFFAKPEVRTRSIANGFFDCRRIVGSGPFIPETILIGDIPDSPDLRAPVSVALGQEEEQILTSPGASVQLRDNHGHTLVFSSQETQPVVYSIDGQPVERAVLTPHHCAFRVPRNMLDGQVHEFAILDRTGSFPLFFKTFTFPRLVTPLSILQGASPAPYPEELVPQTKHRFRSLKALCSNPDAAVSVETAAFALSVLEGGYGRVSLRPLAFETPPAPDVSIIIPAHNKINITYFTLCSLLLAQNKASYEIILVDDASTDETSHIEDFVSGIRVVRNTTPQRFIRACNAGAEKARGTYLALLNNDVEVTSGWLDELLAAFDRFDNVGLAGSKLIYPDGRLQEAGGIVWNTGQPWNYGKGGNPEDPRFCYARQVDYLSGAALMMPLALWKELGGLSSYLEPMYFEDTDLAFKVREAGYSTWFIPSSEVYHYEGATSGTDRSAGFKKYQDANFPKFRGRWQKAFHNLGDEGQNPDLEKDRNIAGRVLFIDNEVPQSDKDAGSYAAVEEIKLVQALGYKVSFLPVNLAHMGPYTEYLQKIGAEIIYAPYYLSPGEYLENHAADFDAFFITRFNVAETVLERIRALAPDAKVLFNNADLHFLREIRMARSQNDPDLMGTARNTRARELDIIQRVDLTLSYNEAEHSVIQAYTEGQARVVTCPWVVRVAEPVAPVEHRKGISFLGGFRHPPNAEGIKWFVKEVMPLISSKDDNGILHIYGSAMTDEIRNLATDNVEPIGFVPDISEAFDRHRVFVAPLLSGAGIKGKVLSAVAHGIPCVLSPVAAEGTGLRHGHDCIIANAPQEWAQAIDKLNSDAQYWAAISGAGQNYVRQAFSAQRGLLKMREAFEAVKLKPRT